MNTKISIAAAKALFDLENFTRDNTQVEADQKSARLLLHGHPVAEYRMPMAVLTVSLCGWSTKTTKARLNAVLDRFGGKIYTKNFVEYLSIWGQTVIIGSTEVIWLDLTAKTIWRKNEGD